MSEKATSSCLKKFRQLSVLHMTYLKYVGLWALDPDSSVFAKCLYYVYNKFVLTTMFVFAATILADIWTNSDDILIVADDGCIFAGMCVVFSKVMVAQFHCERLDRIVNEIIESCYQLCKFPIGDESKILKKYLLVCYVTFYGFGTLGFFLIIALLFFVPLEDGELPVRALYPVDTTQPPWHNLAYFVELCSISIGITVIMGIDSLYTNLCILFLAYLEILNMHFRNCSDEWRRAVENRDNNANIAVRHEICSRLVITSRRNGNYNHPNMIRDRRYFAEWFIRTVRYHQWLFTITNDFNRIFSVGLFIHMLLFTMIICLTGFQVILGTGHGSSTCKFMIYLITAVSQLFYMCWLGNEVIYQNASLTQSQWLSKWSDVISAEIGRLLIPSMIFTKRELNMRAGVFCVLSMETFIAIMGKAYSFFALLNAMQLEANQ